MHTQNDAPQFAERRKRMVREQLVNRGIGAPRVSAEALTLAGTERVLEIGTGSDYTAAVLASLAAEVHTIERIKPYSRAVGCVFAHAPMGAGRIIRLLTP